MSHKYTVVQAEPGLLAEAEFYIVRVKQENMPGIVVGTVRGYFLALNTANALNKMSDPEYNLETEA